MIDWRDMFARYVNVVGRSEGVDFLEQGEWTTEEWVAILELLEGS